MLRKFGSLEAFQRVIVQQDLPGRAISAGLQNLTQEVLSSRVQSCTVNSHRLVSFVTKHYGCETAEKLYFEMNVGHFTESKVLNDSSFLLLCCEKAGLASSDVELCASFLSSSKGTSAVLRVVDELQRMGVHSIPTLCVANGAEVLSGAAGRAEVLSCLRRVAASAIKRKMQGGSGDARPRIAQMLLDGIDEE